MTESIKTTAAYENLVVENETPVLRVIRGLPGSGKSTYGRKFGAILIESDMALFYNGKYTWTPENHEKAIRWVGTMLQLNLLYNHDITLCGVFTKARVFQKHIDLAKKHGYKVEVHRCTANYGNIHDVPEEVLQSMADNMEDYAGEIII